MKRLNNNSYIFKINTILSSLQLFLLLLFFSMLFTVIFFPNDKHGFTTNIEAWFSVNWQNGHTNSFGELLEFNGWIIFYNTFIIIGLWSFILFFLIEYLLLRNYFIINECKHANARELMNFKQIVNNRSFNKNCAVCRDAKQITSKISNKFLISSIFGFVMFWYWFKAFLILKSGKDFRTHFYSETQPKTIDHSEFFLAITLKKKFNQRDFVTGAFYFLLISSSVGLIFMLLRYGFQFLEYENNLKTIRLLPEVIAGDEQLLYDHFVRLSPFASILTYFTQFTNIACFAYAMMTIIKPRANLFRNNTLTVQLGTYILIVAFVYWIALSYYDFVVVIKAKNFSKYSIIPIISTFIIHGLTPLTFLIYSSSLIFLNKIKPKKYWENWKEFWIYPLTYGVFMYSVSIYTEISVYGPMTNINPLNANASLLSPGGVSLLTHGNPFFIFGIFLMVIIMGLFLLGFWGYAHLITKENYIKVPHNYQVKHSQLKRLIKNSNNKKSLGDY